MADLLGAQDAAAAAQLCARWGQTSLFACGGGRPAETPAAAQVAAVKCGLQRHAACRGGDIRESTAPRFVAGAEWLIWAAPCFNAPDACAAAAAIRMAMQERGFEWTA